MAKKKRENKKAMGMWSWLLILLLILIICGIGVYFLISTNSSGGDILRENLGGIGGGIPSPPQLPD